MMNRKTFYAVSSFILLAFGGLWMKQYPTYPIRGIGFGSLLLSTFLFVEVSFWEDKSINNKEVGTK